MLSQAGRKTATKVKAEVCPQSISFGGVLAPSVIEIPLTDIGHQHRILGSVGGVSCLFGKIVNIGKEVIVK